jgi:hypothetical protein
VLCSRLVLGIVMSDRIVKVPRPADCNNLIPLCCSPSKVEHIESSLGLDQSFSSAGALRFSLSKYASLKLRGYLDLQGGTLPACSV